MIPSLLALDLEGTLISNAVSQFPRPGLHKFLDFCHASFRAVYLFTAVNEPRCRDILRLLAGEGAAPTWFAEIPYIPWDRSFKDLSLIPKGRLGDCLIVDDNPDYILPDQKDLWVAIEKFQSPYPADDTELNRVQGVLETQLLATAGPLRKSCGRAHGMDGPGTCLRDRHPSLLIEPTRNVKDSGKHQ